MGKWLYSTMPLEVFTHRNFVADFIVFEPPFDELRGNVRTSVYRSVESSWSTSYSSWLNFFAISYDWDVINGNPSKSSFLEGVGHFERKFQTKGGIACQLLLVSENLSDCPFVWYQNIRSELFSFVTKHACDGQTDRQTNRITTANTALA